MATSDNATVYTGVQTEVQFGWPGVAIFVATAAGVTGFALPILDDNVGEPAAIVGTAPAEVMFRRLADEWERELMRSPSSSLTKLVLLPSYQRIIGLGMQAVPAILAEFQARPNHWWWALEAITGENPAPPAATGNLDAIRDSWLAWGRARGHLA